MITGQTSGTASQNGSRFRWFCVRGGSDIADYTYIPTTADATAAGGCTELKAIAVFPQCWNGVDTDIPGHKAHVAFNDYYSGCNTTVERSSDLAVVSASGYPMAFPEISVNIHTPIPNIADLDYWRLSSDIPQAEAVILGGTCTALTNWCAGRAWHADWVNGWSSAANGGAGYAWGGLTVTQAIQRNCYGINPDGSAVTPEALSTGVSPISRDCHNHLLGSPNNDNHWWTLY
jgi:hypothetical protein